MKKTILKRNVQITILFVAVCICQVLFVLVVTPLIYTSSNQTSFWGTREISSDVVSLLPKIGSATLKKGNHLHDNCQRLTFNISHPLLPVEDGSVMSYPPPIPYTRNGVRLGIEPKYGKHQCHQNAILSFVYGYQLPQIIHFITTLIRSGFKGDLVLGTGTDLTQESREYLEYISSSDTTTATGIELNVVVYEIELSCVKRGNSNPCQAHRLFQDATTGECISDFRKLRRVATLRFEYYWAWSSLYAPDTQLFFTDARDVYFQGNPMVRGLEFYRNAGYAPNTTIIMFEEAATIAQSRANSRWILKTYSETVLQQIAEKPVLCSGTTLGGQPAMETYARAMVYEFDHSNCGNCAKLNDQCFHNYLVHTNRLEGANGGSISTVVTHKQGEGGIVNTVGLVSLRHDGASLHDLGLIQSESMAILDNDKTTTSAVIHMYDRDAGMKEWVSTKITQELLEWNNTGRVVPPA